MKKILLFLLINTSVFCFSQKNLSTKDSINIFYKAVFKNLKSEYLHKNKVNWKKLENETKNNLSKYSTFTNSLDEIEPIFTKIDANHSRVKYKNKSYRTLKAKTLSLDKLSNQWQQEFAKKPTFNVKIINDSIGYILMPQVHLSDYSTLETHKVSQSLYDQIENIKSSNNVKGWILDLRFNTGGDVFPMILSLYDFLGDNVIWNSLNADNKLISKYHLKNGIYYFNNITDSYIIPKGKSLINEKIALITSSVTASSGEILCLAFKGRENTRFIGQESYGESTGNGLRILPFGISMFLTTSYSADRNLNVYDKILPDVEIKDGDNFDNLLLDKNIQEAISFIKGK